MLTVRLLAVVALLTIASSTVFAQEPEKKSESPAASTEQPAPVVVGNPPADHPFGKLKIGMSYDEVIAIVGEPTDRSVWCTGKSHIPFYFGRDRGRAAALFKGQGKLEFNADVRIAFACWPKDPTDLVYIEYDPSATGEFPK